LESCVSRSAEDLIDAAVVKKNRNAAWRKEKRHALARKQSARVVDFQTLTAVQLDGENLKRLSFREDAKR
jgi:hypothetical protein